MRKLTLLLSLLLYVFYANAQSNTGYYNGTEGKDGDELKAALNDIISGHQVWSYSSSKTIFKLSDADPDNADNVILVYTGRSEDNGNYGTGGNYINREHVWAKSHGFNYIPPMYGDAHNLKPSDASVNQDKSNKDFDNGGTQHPEATGCYYTEYTWEARDEVKGDIARIIFYMSTRYEGENGESDLEVVDAINTSPLPEHGRLSTLLEWNLQDPPDDFEMNRNNVIYTYQRNRNPFVDDPNFAQLIWGGGIAATVAIGNVSLNPVMPVAGEAVEVKANISSTEGDISSAQVKWGLAWNELGNTVEMSVVSGDSYSGSIPGQAEGTYVYYSITATNEADDVSSSVVYVYYVPKPFTGTLISIYDIQGQQVHSPYKGQVVSTTGIITGKFEDHYYIQDGFGKWNGLFVYDAGKLQNIGDSIIVTGLIEEWYDKTEMKEISDYYFISANHDLPEPLEVMTGEVEEGHEGVVVKVKEAVCTDNNYQGNHGMWTVNDGSGILRILNTAVFEYEPTLGTPYDIKGPMNWDFDEWKIDLRYEDDVQLANDNTPPTVTSIEIITKTNIKVVFSEDVDQQTGEDAGNYSVNNDITVDAANQHALVKSQVNLTVSELIDGNYEIIIQNVADLSGNVMVPVTIPFSVGIEELFNGAEVNIYPVPVKDKINIEFTMRGPETIQLSVMNITGLAIYEQHHETQAGRNKLSLDLENMSSGPYFIRLSSSHEVFYRIIVVQ